MIFGLTQLPVPSGPCTPQIWAGAHRHTPLTISIPTPPSPRHRVPPLDNHEANIPHLFRGLPLGFGEEEEGGMKDAGRDAHPWSPAGASLRRQPPGVGSATHVCGEGGVGTRVYTVYIYHRGTGAGGVTDQRSRQPTAHPQVGKSALIFHPRGAQFGSVLTQGWSVRLRFMDRSSPPC